ncbi:L,D-transpeptidase family protein [Oceanivirga salmonicida]|uniref:L,D-transpeptidase family protein n=1 Tax=Oceanivirga salmonicida TaxID=1769291 RepID=UPI00082F3763|nr:L,D-transpeptidase family protein [Oceanivirga salmonicida]
MKKFFKIILFLSVISCTGIETKVNSRENNNIGKETQHYYKHIEKYDNLKNRKLKFEIDLKKFERTYDNYIFVKRTSNIRELPTVKSKKILQARKYEKLGLISLVKNNIDEEWYKIITRNGKVGYIRSDLAIKRKYNYEDAIQEIEKLNSFIEKYKGKIKVLSKFVPLDTSSDGKADSKGNYANQSVKVYTSESRKVAYNLPDRAIFRIVKETKKFLIIESPFYNTLLYYPKSLRNYIESAKINQKVNKFIYISIKNQNQITFEFDKNGTYKIKLISDITTGKRSKYGFPTPKGHFLIALSKPVMSYVNYDNKEEVEIIGEARYAIRFSGGGYLHGLPYRYEPKETLVSRKRGVKKLLGTYPLSNKCVRNHDEIIEYLYNWIEHSRINKAGHRIPTKPVMVIVK